MESGRFFAHISLAMVSALAGLFHVVYCCLLFTSGVGLLNAVALLAVGVCGLVKWRPGARFLVYTHLLLLAGGIAVLLVNSVGIHCSRRRGACPSGWSTHMQELCLSHFGAQPALLQGMARIHTAIHALLIMESSFQILLSLAVISRHFFAFLDAIRDQLNVFYMQTMVAVLLLMVGCPYTMYCGRLFFVGVPIWASLVLITTSSMQNWRLPVQEQSRRVSLVVAAPDDSEKTIADTRHRCRCRRCLSWLSLCMCTLLMASCIWAGICWSAYPLSIRPRSDTSVNVTITSDDDVCTVPQLHSVYRSCYESLETVGFWHRSVDADMSDVGQLQQTLAVSILLLALLELSLCALVEYRHCRGYRSDGVKGVAV